MKKSKLKKIIKDLVHQVGKEEIESVLKEGLPLKEGKGQDAATDLILRLRRTLYRKFSDQDLEEFSQEMAQHFNATINELVNEVEFESVLKESSLDRFSGFSDKTLQGALMMIMKIPQTDLKARENIKKMSRDELEKKLTSLKGLDETNGLVNEVENGQWSQGDVSEVYRQLILTQKTLRNGASHMNRLIEVLSKHSNKPQGDKLAGMIPDSYQVIDILNKMDNFNKGFTSMFPHLSQGVNEDEINFSDEEMTKLHKDGQLEKGDHSFKYKVTKKNDQTSRYTE